VALKEEKRLHATTKSSHASDLSQLLQVKAQYAANSTRAATAETTGKYFSGRYRKCDEESKDAKNRLRAQANKLDAERRVALGARKELEALAKELDAAKKENSTAKEQIKKIRDEMKKANGSQAQKRQSDGNDPCSQSKRARTEQ
jgi:predicted  nucleic acid-binding Zn-ribbon protein